MKPGRRRFPFRLSAPSMVYGADLMENIRRLSAVVDQVELLFFDAPEGNNFPTGRTIRHLARWRDRTGLAYSVHLPASLEPASPRPEQRARARDIVALLHERLEALEPAAWILHLPYRRPTLVPVPGQYCAPGDMPDGAAWSERARQALQAFVRRLGPATPLLVENINYSPEYLYPLLDATGVGFCLDIGHLFLGREDPDAVLPRALPRAREVHLHGVDGAAEHLSLTAYGETEQRRWLSWLGAFRGVVNLEVFSPEHLRESLQMIETLLGAAPAGGNVLE